MAIPSRHGAVFAYAAGRRRPGGNPRVGAPRGGGVHHRRGRRSHRAAPLDVLVEAGLLVKARAGGGLPYRPLTARGIIEGVLRQRGAADDTALLEPFGAPDGCVVRLGPAQVKGDA